MSKRPNNSRSRRNQSGNAFIMILVGVVLMAGLMFTFSRSARQGGTDMNDREAAIAVTDVMSFAQRTSRAIDRAMRKSISEVDLSFATPALEGYENLNCTEEKCLVFNVEGGGLTYTEPERKWFGDDFINNAIYGNWVFTANNGVIGAGNDCLEAGCVDLVMVLPFLKENMCIAINENLSIENPGGTPPKTSSGINLTPFTGTYQIGSTIGKNNDEPFGNSACVLVESGQYTGTYHFYHVIKER